MAKDKKNVPFCCGICGDLGFTFPHACTGCGKVGSPLDAYYTQPCKAKVYDSVHFPPKNNINHRCYSVPLHGKLDNEPWKPGFVVISWDGIRETPGRKGLDLIGPIPDDMDKATFGSFVTDEFIHRMMEK